MTESENPARAEERDPDAIYVSPHLDDVVFSCGGQIRQRTAAGERVLVVTVFAGAPATGTTPLAAELHELWGLPRDPRAALAARREEDRAALAFLGAELVHWDLVDAVYRGESGSAGLVPGDYPTLRSLFGPLRRDRRETALLEDVTTRLRALPPAPHIFGPLAVGRHVDHALVRRAIERAYADDPRVRSYEELPYARRFLAVRRALRSERGGRFVHETVRLGPEDLEAKCRAIACYASQLGAVFRDERELRREIGRYHRRRRGERLWRFVASGRTETQGSA